MSNTNHNKRNSGTDLEWCIDRLEHLLFIYDNPRSISGSFGPSETMDMLRDSLPEIRKFHGMAPYDPPSTKTIYGGFISQLIERLTI